ncbi:MAG: alpha/beta hydrolase [Chloroflexota bacterium]
MRTGALALAALVLIAVACTGAEAKATTQLIDIGGYKLSVTCRGDAAAPTVVIEAGRGNVSGDWHDVESDVSKFARVCSYDRAGLGASDPRPTTATGDDVARELHTALDNLDIAPPYVIAAHSIGVLYARLFAEQYPADISGMVFVDGSHEDQFITGGEDRAIFGNEGSSRIDLTDAVSELQNARPLGQMPLVVLHGGAATDAAWFGYHYKQAMLSANSELVIANFSGHFIYDSQPSVVTEAIRQVVEAAGAHGPLSDCERSFSGGDAVCVPLTR